MALVVFDVSQGRGSPVEKKSGEGFVGCVNRYTVSMVTLTLAALFASSRIVISFFPLLM